MCTLSMDSQRCAAGYDRFPTGGNEPILTLDGERILDAKGRVSRVTTAGAGPSVGKYLLLRLPPAGARRRRHQAAGDVHERVLPGHRRARQRHAAVRPRRLTHEVMRILVCVKRVPAPGARINIAADGQAIDTAFLGFTMSPHEECAVEEAVQLVEQHGGEATVLTLGAVEADEQLRYAASLGVANAVLLSITGPDWDPQRICCRDRRAIIADIEASDGAFDLILFGNESADQGGFQGVSRPPMLTAVDRQRHQRHRLARRHARRPP